MSPKKLYCYGITNIFSNITYKNAEDAVSSVLWSLRTEHKWHISNAEMIISGKDNLVNNAPFPTNPL